MRARKPPKTPPPRPPQNSDTTPGCSSLFPNPCFRPPPLVPVIQQWGAKHRVDGVIWTDLRSNFDDETGNPFTVERARDYLLGLPKSAADRARRYINNAPPEVDTPLRRAMQQARWL